MYLMIFVYHHSHNLFQIQNRGRPRTSDARIEVRLIIDLSNNTNSSIFISLCMRSHVLGAGKATDVDAALAFPLCSRLLF